MNGALGADGGLLVHEQGLLRMERRLALRLGHARGRNGVGVASHDGV